MILGIQGWVFLIRFLRYGFKLLSMSNGPPFWSYGSVSELDQGHAFTIRGIGFLLSLTVLVAAGAGNSPFSEISCTKSPN